MATLEATNVKFHSCKDLEEAQDRAQKAAVNTSGAAFPGVLFQQGARYFLSTAIPMGFVRQRLKRQSAQKRGSVKDALDAVNRPLDDGHVQTVVKYLKENNKGKYILPPITLNVQHAIDVYTIDVESTFKSAYLVVPMTAMLSITDGQHRQAAIESLADSLPMDELQRLDQDSVAVMITCESDIAQVHQDFADCSKTKALPQSQLAVYDRRNPANGIVLDLIDRCPLFKGKVDAVSASLGKKSLALFLSNQVRQLVKELLVGSYAESEVTFEKKAHDLLGAHNSPTYENYLAQFAEYINEVTQVVPVLRQISELQPDLQLNKIPELRSQGWICLSATGMNVIGRIGHIMFREKITNWHDYAKKLGSIDWRRDADMWQGNIVGEGRIQTQQTPLRAAVAAVQKAIGLPDATPITQERPL